MSFLIIKRCRKKPVWEANHELEESDCVVCPNGYEYRFNPIEYDWSTHRTNAEYVGSTLATIQSSEEQTTALRAMEPYNGQKYQSAKKFEGLYVLVGMGAN